MFAHPYDFIKSFQVTKLHTHCVGIVIGNILNLVWRELCLVNKCSST